ncbi:pyruvate kinase [Desulfuromonas versatilis]|uniref:Pyruvate kinase n=1 Tax=Desulfuromonas versatilis TaxID=2802975 RepID=A0ABN6DY98_9BACT|nr:pyruvate kinase [Desulfuromonas versatilis]BCR04904.1 pyruvate kinase [Desulfuromonas versatilis]
MFRRTKIVATVGPACESKEMLNALLEAGVDVFRLNFSHGDHGAKAAIIDHIRTLSKLHQRAVAILGDLQGPKIRTGVMQGGALQLVAGEEITLTTREVLGEARLVPTQYRELPGDVTAGNRILLDDGLMELEVISSGGTEVRCRVVSGGVLKDKKGMNLPGVAVSAPALTPKDEEDLAFCIEQGLDYVALSFIRQASDVLALRDMLVRNKAGLQIIAKIEKPEAVDNFPAILEAADGIMVARGDLGVEIRPEKVPLIQKRIIRKCNEAGKPVITATQMLESMVTNPRPTRAETSDVANAILDGTDAVMLSAETASGKFPLEAVSVMVQVALDVEGDPQLKEKVFQPVSEIGGVPHVTEAIGQGACRMAEAVGAKAILAFTQTGSTAALVSKYRPSMPIYAVTPSQAVRRRLALYAGVRSIRVDIEGDTEAQIRSVEDAVLSSKVLEQGELVVITMGSPLSDPGTTNLLKVHRLGALGYYPKDLN